MLHCMDTDTPRDELPGMIADVDQYTAGSAQQVARLLAAEYLALVSEGVPSIAAAIMVGTRWRS